MVELLAELLPYNSPTTVKLLVQVLEAIPKEFSLNKCAKGTTYVRYFFIVLLYNQLMQHLKYY